MRKTYDLYENKGLTAKQLRQAYREITRLKNDYEMTTEQVYEYMLDALYEENDEKGGEVMFKVEFTQGNASQILIETADREQAAAVAVQKQAEFKAEQKKGIISLYEITTEAGTPMRKCYDFWEV